MVDLTAAAASGCPIFSTECRRTGSCLGHAPANHTASMSVHRSDVSLFPADEAMSARICFALSAPVQRPSACGETPDHVAAVIPDSILWRQRLVDRGDPVSSSAGVILVRRGRQKAVCDLRRVVGGRINAVERCRELSTAIDDLECESPCALRAFVLDVLGHVANAIDGLAFVERDDGAFGSARGHGTRSDEHHDAERDRSERELDQRRRSTRLPKHATSMPESGRCTAPRVTTAALASPIRNLCPTRVDVQVAVLVAQPMPYAATLVPIARGYAGWTSSSEYSRLVSDGGGCFHRVEPSARLSAVSTPGPA